MLAPGGLITLAPVLSEGATDATEVVAGIGITETIVLKV